MKTLKEKVLSAQQQPKTSILHENVIEQILSDIKPVDFQIKIYGAERVESLRKAYEKALKEFEDTKPGSESRMNAEKGLNQAKNDLKALKIKESQYLILSIESLLELAENLGYGLCRSETFCYIYNGTYWKYLDEAQIESFLGKVAERQGIDIYQARFYKFQIELRKQFFASAFLRKPIERENVLVNLANGTFEIKQNGDAILRDYNKEDFLTYQLPFDYDEKAKYQKFQKFLDVVLPDQKLQTLLAEHIGYLLIPNSVLALEKAPFLYGTGANGKSVLFKIINALLGRENVSNYSLKGLTDDSGYTRAKLANKLVNYATEINGTLQTDYFKQLVSGEPVEARLPYKEPFNMTSYAKLFFNCNELPKEVEHTNAYFRRFDIIPFTVTIPEANQDKDLADKIIKDELPGIFNWALQGMRMLLTMRSFTLCEAVEKERIRYKDESNTLKLFLIDEEYEKDETATTGLKELYREYKIYCDSSGYKSLNLKNFKNRLLGEGYEIVRRNFGNVVFIIKHTSYEV